LESIAEDFTMKFIIASILTTLATVTSSQRVGRSTEVIFRTVKPGYEEEHLEAADDLAEFILGVDSVVVRKSM